MGNRHSVTAYCHQLPWWNKALQIVSSPEDYKLVINSMFEDGKVNRGRLAVLEVFTTDVCAKHPHLTTEIQHIYESTKREFLTVK